MRDSPGLRARRFLARTLPALALPLATLAGAAGPVPDVFPDVGAAYFVTVDDRPVFGAQAQRALPPASLAKIMTALLVAEHDAPDAVVTVSARAAAAPGARAGLRAGERWRAGDLLAAMLLASANDACLALAEHAAGTEHAFVAQMNRRAQALRLAATSFANACGHDAPGMLTTALDLAQLAPVALRQEAIAQAARTEAHSIRAIGGRTIRLRNTNAFVGRVPGVTGLKTGYTRLAGRNLVLTAERDGHRVTVILLGARDRWWDAAAMLERAFDTVRAGR